MIDIFVPILAIAIIFFIILSRTFNKTEIDDVHPLINCSANKLAWIDVYWVIPIYKGVPITEDREWCDKIKNSGKILGMHGVYHTHNEFSIQRSPEYIKEGMEVFKDAFGYYPTLFKAPRTNISKENLDTVKRLGMTPRGKMNQVLKSVYHCGKDMFGDLP